MNCYIVCYDLTKDITLYAPFFEEMKKFHNWWHHFEKTSIILATNTADEVRKILQKHIDDQDKLFVGTLSGNISWTGINEEGTKWLKELK